MAISKFRLILLGHITIISSLLLLRHLHRHRNIRYLQRQIVKKYHPSQRIKNLRRSSVVKKSVVFCVWRPWRPRWVCVSPDSDVWVLLSLVPWPDPGPLIWIVTLRRLVSSTVDKIIRDDVNYNKEKFCPSSNWHAEKYLSTRIISTQQVNKAKNFLKLDFFSLVVPILQKKKLNACKFSHIHQIVTSLLWEWVSIQIINGYECNGKNIFMRWKMKNNFIGLSWFFDPYINLPFWIWNGSHINKGKKWRRLDFGTEGF